MGKKPKGRGKQSAQKRMKAVADTNLHHIERTSSKQVSASAMNITAYRDQKVKWTTDEMDVDCGRNGCGWSWKLASNETKVLLDFLSTLHTMTWGDWESHRTNNGRKHHSQRIDSLSRSALKRLREINPTLDQAEEELFRFRLGSTRRLWGYRSGATFRILWWDDHHQVYPTEPKNT
ncbi:hypothetical protein HMPREF9997_00500 [Corynebacterium durum F0235]|uniref:Uncharacterized protein n=1 Tax=Corynebacterium durum F0235 TaxID=1035195 RepID=L1MKV6_9CORY|nr:hypothetical protein HMPREF9997_00500 [Corynebacterium durum F0235]